MLLLFIKHLRNDAIEQTHKRKQSVKLSLRQTWFLYGLYSSNAVFFFVIQAPCLGLHLNLHDDPNMNEQKTVLLT